MEACRFRLQSVGDAKAPQIPSLRRALSCDLLHLPTPACKASCFCNKVGCTGIWTLQPTLQFELFLSHFSSLWVRGSNAFCRAVNDFDSGPPPRWANGVRLLREIKKRWPNWDENGNSLPAVVGQIRRCYFCDDSFARIAPIVERVRGLGDDTTGVYGSKLTSQLFYDIAVPFDTASATKQRKWGYDPESYGGGRLHGEIRHWLLSNKKSIDDFRTLDNAPASCWSSPGRGTACSRVIDKLFYGS